MALRLPTYERQVAPSGPATAVSGPKASAAVYDRGSQGMGAMGQALGQLAQAAKTVEDRRTLTGVMADMQGLREEYAQFEIDNRNRNKLGNGVQAVGETEEFFTRKKAELGEKWGGSNLAMQYLEREFGNFATGSVINARQYANQQTQAWQRQSWENDAAYTVERAKDLTVSDADLSVDVQTVLASGDLLFGEDADRSRKLAEQVRLGRQEGVRQRDFTLAMESPYAALEGIAAYPQDGQAAGYESFLPTEYAAHVASVHALASKQLAGLMKQNDAESRGAREVAEKELYAMYYDGSLTRAAVEERRDILPPEFYGKAVGWTTGQGSLPDRSDPEAVITLTRLAVNGDADLMAVADSYLRSGQLTIADYRAAINEGQQFRDPVIKRGLEEIRIRTGYSEMNPNPAAADSYIAAKNDFLAWLDSEAGQKAGTQEKLEMANQIAGNYQLANMNSMITAKVPLYLVGSRTQPDINATIKQTDGAYRAGRLTEQQYQEQLIRIKNLDSLIEQQRAADEAASNRRGRR